MPTNSINTGSSGRKRPADDGFDPLTDPVNTKPIPAYDPKKEQQPYSVIQSKDWKTYKDHEKQIQQLIIETLAQLDCKNKSTREFVESVPDRIAGRQSGKVILCFTGLLGTGKSATLNSLFSVGPIARQGDSGGSCTLASSMYQARKRDQQEPFLAEVHFFNRVDRREILANYLAAYYYANYGHAEDHDTSSESCQSLDDTNADLDIRTEVITALVSLFGNHPQCRTKQQARTFLDSAKSPGDPTVLEQLYAWCDSLITRATGGQSVISVAASTPGELNSALENFTAYSEDEHGELLVSLTPMVSLIKFYFDDPLTACGITFLDTPGSSDCNQARRKSANENRKLRTHSAILSDEARVRDDSGISKEVKYMRNKGHGRTVVIITRSDVIQPDTTHNGAKKDIERRERLKDGVKRYKNELNAVEIQESDATEGDDFEHLVKLTKEKKELEVRVKLVENAETALRISMRSESNKRALREKLQDITGAPIPIFSISNTEYAKHLEGYPAKRTPVLDVGQTNIPALRRLISTFPNETRLNEIKHQQECNLPGLLELLGLYTTRDSSDRKAEMEVYVESPLNRYANSTRSIWTNFEKEIAAVLVTMRAQEQVWTKLAGGLCDCWWDEFNTSVFSNLLKRDGRRKGNQKNRELNLSADLIHISSGDMETFVKRIVPWIHHFEKAVADEMDFLVSHMIQRMRDDPNEAFMSLDNFYNYIQREKSRISACIEATFAQIIDGVDNILRKVTSEDEDAYLVQAMLPIYDHVKQLKGGKDQKQPRPKIGWPAYRKLAFKNEVTRVNGVWATVYANVAGDFEILLRKESERLVTGIGKVFQDFHKTFHMLCEVKNTTEPAEIKILEELKMKVDKARQILDGPMRQLYEGLERDFRQVGFSYE